MNFLQNPYVKSQVEDMEFKVNTYWENHRA